MIVVTGAAGFIASCLIEELNTRFPNKDIIAVDRFDESSRLSNIKHKNIRDHIDRNALMHWLEKNHKGIDVFFHYGARTDTLETETSIFNSLNLEFSKSVWAKCALHGIPLIYASSAATYGTGEQGFSDHHKDLEKLEPLNAYARSKHEFDLWVIEQKKQPPYWYGLKFFNVFGPNEYHKGNMASMIYQGYQQIQKTGSIRLFKSYKNEFEHGAQSRDFIYVKDIVSLSIALFEKGNSVSGIYNIGSGTSSSFNEMAEHLFSSLSMTTSIEYIEMPLNIRKKYQYYTVADISKLELLDLKWAGYTFKDAVLDYVKGYLLDHRYF